MKTFRELTELSIAAIGDWDEGMKELSPYTENIIELKWNLVDVFKFDNQKYEFRQMRNSLNFILGSFKNEKFYPVFKIFMARQKTTENKLRLKKLVNVNGVAVTQEMQGMGVAKTIYKYLVNQLHFTILADETQYFGARKLWSRLSKELDVTVDVIDIEKKEFLKKNVDIVHGKLDNEFDKEFWSRNDDKKNVRFILTKIKE